MKAQNDRLDVSEMQPYRLGRHWNTIQAYLIPGIEDDIGELSEELRKFMEICELLIDDKMFAKYRWCGNGRPPSSRISLFKAYILGKTGFCHSFHSFRRQEYTTHTNGL